MKNYFQGIPENRKFRLRLAVMSSKICAARHNSTALGQLQNPSLTLLILTLLELVYIFICLYIYTHTHPILFTEEPGTAFSGSNKTPGLDCTKAPKLKVKLRSNVDTSSAHVPEEIHLLSRNG